MHIHSSQSVSRLSTLLIIATTPVLLLGLWNVGQQILQSNLHEPASMLSEQWLDQWGLLSFLGFQGNPASPIACLMVGFVQYFPLLLVAGGVSFFWASLFSRFRHRSIDPGWFVCSWIFVLLLPPALPLAYVVIAMSFGVVLGCHIFGGTGRYIVNPALLGALFLSFSYPEIMQESILGPGSEVLTSWNYFAHNGVGEWSILPFLLGREVGAMGTASQLAIILAAVLLTKTGALSWRIILGGVVGVVFSASLMHVMAEGIVAHLSAVWHLALGNLAFALVFLATDSSTAPLTRPSRWAFGFLFGLIAVLFRTLDPQHPEATFSALLLATLLIPLIDYLVIEYYRRRSVWH